ncbi:dCTP deaminase [Pseudomonas guariconensis]|uniref:dCTP deaminase n=1 Tax=Pseudomonas guariconensis TaxID=1288410 RepID=UPI0018A9D81D|nr:deoxycytidine triphosphate deaminase [Pseudomonas guariconensis]MBF8742098.1 deoxycytidine triphosphate deaminase [Pseudomonas guariconensis]MBF8751094.1 deoxycytidine triphosphate deaminase [Pseudomonas guariconensis]
MIVTAKNILQQVKKGSIVISPFDESLLDVNSYSFRLGRTLIEFDGSIVDSSIPTQETRVTIPQQGYLLQPDRFYLASTLEKMGSTSCASELYANFSTAACGIFIQTSAPLGHTGAIINWTLEIVVAQPVIIYPEMVIGKICFWENFGELLSYQGRYQNSDNVVSSRIYQDFT